MKKCTRCKPGLMVPRRNPYYPNVTMMVCENCNFTYAIRQPKRTPARTPESNRGQAKGKAR